VVYDKLGFRKEDERASKLKQDACNASDSVASMNEFADDYVCELICVSDLGKQQLSAEMEARKR
jgi:hypothetical protein